MITRGVYENGEAGEAGRAASSPILMGTPDKTGGHAVGTFVASAHAVLPRCTQGGTCVPELGTPGQLGAVRVLLASTHARITRYGTEKLALDDAFFGWAALAVAAAARDAAPLDTYRPGRALAIVSASWCALDRGRAGEEAAAVWTIRVRGTLTGVAATWFARAAKKAAARAYAAR